jgi:hypothetical protein
MSVVGGGVLVVVAESAGSVSMLGEVVMTWVSW